MRSGRNRWLATGKGPKSLGDWDMRSGRNNRHMLVKFEDSLGDWDMRSGRNRWPERVRR